jgi:hypothetical protein
MEACNMLEECKKFQVREHLDERQAGLPTQTEKKSPKNSRF